MAALGYLPKLKRALGLALGVPFLHDFSRNVYYLTLYQWTKFQCHTFSPSQNIKQNVPLSYFLDNSCHKLAKSEIKINTIKYKN